MNLKQSIGHEHYLACHASVSKQLLRLSGLNERKPPRDDRLDLLLLKEVEQGNQVLSKHRRFQPFEPLDAIGNYTFPAGEKQTSRNIQPEDRDPMMPTRSHPGVKGILGVSG